MSVPGGGWFTSGFFPSWDPFNFNLFPGDDCVFCFPLGPSPLEIVRQILSANFSALGLPTIEDLRNSAAVMDAEGMTPTQCAAARTLLAREQKYGTTIAAWQSAIGYGDGTVQAFNSTNTAPIDSPLGPIKIDWYTDLQLAGPFGDPLLYPVAKLTWTGIRKAMGAPITNALPFQDLAESNAWLQSQNPFSTYSSIFTPQFMAQNCH